VVKESNYSGPVKFRVIPSATGRILIARNQTPAEELESMTRANRVKSFPSANHRSAVNLDKGQPVLKNSKGSKG